MDSALGKQSEGDGLEPESGNSERPFSRRLGSRELGTEVPGRSRCPHSARPGEGQRCREAARTRAGGFSIHCLPGHALLRKCAIPEGGRGRERERKRERPSVRAGPTRSPGEGDARLVPTRLARSSHRRRAATETLPSASSGGTLPGLRSKKPSTGATRWGFRVTTS